MQIAHKTSCPIGGEIRERGHIIYTLDSRLRGNDTLGSLAPIFGRTVHAHLRWVPRRMKIDWRCHFPTYRDEESQGVGAEFTLTYASPVEGEGNKVYFRGNDKVTIVQAIVQTYEQYLY